MWSGRAMPPPGVPDAVGKSGGVRDDGLYHPVGGTGRRRDFWGGFVSLRGVELTEIPEETARVACAVFPKGDAGAGRAGRHPRTGLEEGPEPAGFRGGATGSRTSLPPPAPCLAGTAGSSPRSGTAPRAGAPAAHPPRPRSRSSFQESWRARPSARSVATCSIVGRSVPGGRQWRAWPSRRVAKRAAHPGAGRASTITPPCRGRAVAVAAVAVAAQERPTRSPSVSKTWTSCADRLRLVRDPACAVCRVGPWGAAAHFIRGVTAAW